jgi:predicted phage-related endonuclease
MSVYEEKESYATSRAGGLGGTDMAAVLGLSPWKKPIEIYAGKVNPGAQPELDAEQLFWGSALEPIVRDRFAVHFHTPVIAPQDLGAKFPRSRPWRDSTLIEGDESWMLGAPDGYMRDTPEGLEIKCSARKGHEWGDEESDEIPAHYYVQASWYMAVCKAEAWNFGVLFSGNTLQRYRIIRDEAFEMDMVEAGRTFWHDYVLKKVEPPIDESESYGRYLARKFSLNNQEILQPTPEILDWAGKMKLADDKEKAAKEEKQLANNNLRALVGNAQKVITPLGTLGWVRPEARPVIDWKGVAEKHQLTHPEITKEFTKIRKDDPYFRAWYKK